MTTPSDEKSNFDAAARAVSLEGYARLPGVLTPAETAAYLAEARALYERERAELVGGVRQSYADYKMYSQYGDHIYNLARKTRAFDALYEHPTALAVLKAAMKERFILTQTEMRRPKGGAPAGSANVFHRDGRFIGDGEFWITLFWALEDITPSNGPTGVIPRSHKTAVDAEKEAGRQIQLTAKAGDLIAMNSNLLHRACASLDSTSRWVVIITYNKWYLKPAVDHTRILTRAEFDKASPQLKDVFGYSSIPPVDERKRVHTCRPWEEVLDEIPFKS